jgi:hypothetical protein
MARRFSVLLKTALGIALALSMAAFPLLAADGSSILDSLKSISTLTSTVPGNGDVNPYGLVRVPRSTGLLHEGDYLVSNFNNINNAQGTGTTIVEISPGGSLSLFAEINPANLPGPCTGGVGLTTALAVLQTGWVIVGSLPTVGGAPSSSQAGCLLVLNSNGHVVETIYGSLINGPWDMTWWDSDTSAVLFVTNVLNGTVAANGHVVEQGTIVRVNLSVSEATPPFVDSMTVIAYGFLQRTDPVALVIGATGVGLSPPCEYVGDPNCVTASGGQVLYVADTLKNCIQVITDPFTRTTPEGTGTTLTSGGTISGPLGLNVAPNGHIIVVNGANGWATEVTPGGAQIAARLLDDTGSPPGNGALFGVLYDPVAVALIYVDDNSNTLNKLQ